MACRIILIVFSLSLISIAQGREPTAVRWGRQIVTPTKDSIFSSMVTDSNDGIYMAVTRESEDASGDTSKRRYLLKFNQNGDQVYIGGRTLGHWENRKSQRGYGDAFVARITATGELLWKRQFGTPGWDKTFHVARFLDGSGDLLAGGCQYPTGRYCQAFCRRYSPEGELIWTKIFHKRSVRGGTCGRSVAVDRDNNCYHAGPTHADLFGVNNGTTNVFIVRFDGK